MAISGHYLLHISFSWTFPKVNAGGSHYHHAIVQCVTFMHACTIFCFELALI
jgi:hypothetical protein